MIKLKPCPFCGSTRLASGSIVCARKVFVFCQDCGVDGPGAETDELAAKRWNTRSDTAARARGMREAALAVRAACAACDDGVFEVEPDGTPVECEYCGRPMEAIRQAADDLEKQG